MAPSILHIGLPWDHPILVSIGHNPDVIHAGLDRSQELMLSAGYDYLFLPFGPEDGVVPLEETIAKKKWDGIVVGNGVRSTKDLTPFLEQIVNTIVEKTPSTKILFNVSPESTLDAAQRWFPIA